MNAGCTTHGHVPSEPSVQARQAIERHNWPKLLACDRSLHSLLLMMIP